MRKIVSACLSVLIYVSTQAQVAKPEKTFVIKIKDVWSKSDEYRDSLKIENNIPFKIVVDTVGTPSGVSISSILLQELGNRREVREDGLATEEFTIGKDSSYTFTFLVVKRLSVKKDSLHAMVKITIL